MNEHVQKIQQFLIAKINAVSDGVNGRINGINTRIDALADSVGNLSTKVQRIMAMFVSSEHPAKQPIPAPVQQPIPVPQIPQMPQVLQQPAFQQPAQGLQVPDGHGYPPLRLLAPGPIPSNQLQKDNSNLSLNITAIRRRNIIAQKKRVWNA
jgi:hypothetical protein